MDFLILIKNGCDNLTATAAPSVDSLGLHMVLSLATIMMAWFGVQEALASAQGGPGFNMAKFLNFFLLLTFAYCFVKFYDGSIPGIGYSLKSFISGGTSSLVDYIGNDSTQEVQTTIHKALAKVGTMSPSLTEPYTLLCTYTVQIVLSILTALIAVIIAYGAIGATIIGLLGPVFIPWMVFDKTDFLFWGWLKAFIGFEFYKVVAAATLSVMSHLLISYLTSGAMNVDDGPALILTPATLCKQWQGELRDKLGIPSAVWLSNKKVWLDPNDHIIQTRGALDVGKCPYQIGIVSTGLIFHNAPEAKALLERRFGTLILDEAHRARRAQGISSKDDEPNNLLKFMREAAKHARHVILGTATPIQTEVGELWDLLGVLNSGANHVLGRDFSRWKQTDDVLPILTGEKEIRDEVEAWNLIRNPLPPRNEGHLFDHIRSDLQLRKDQHYSDRPVTDLDEFTRSELQEEITQRGDSLSFFQRNNPILRHTVLRKRATLEELGLLDRIAVDIWPGDNEMLSVFDGVALRTSAEFDAAYEAANAFAAALAKRTQAAGFMKTMMQSRICSSIASGLATAEKLLKKKIQLDEEDEEAALLFDRMPDIIDEERFYLDRIVHFLKQRPTDPKLDAVVHFLTVRGWLELGCIIFSQYFDTANWVAKSLTELLPEERVAVYAGAGKSGLFYGGEWRSVERDDIKKAVRDRTIRLVVATDAACEGLNLQTLGTLINVDLPWNPSRLEQRIGRIKRIGQTRDRVDMLNLVYRDTNDEKVYGVLSQRMKDRYDLFGSLPDTIEDDWIEDVENLEEHLRQFTERKKRANAFEIRYASSVQPDGPGWEQCERVLARRDIVGRLSVGW